MHRCCALQCYNAPLFLLQAVGGLRVFGFYWGVLGVLLLIGSAVHRLLPQVWALGAATLQWYHWLLLVVLALIMHYVHH